MNTLKKQPKRKLTDRIKNKMKRIKDNNKYKKNVNQLVDNWKDIMYETGSYTQSNFTFTLINIKKESYGWQTDIVAPKGTNLEDLEKLKPLIETGLGCIFLYIHKKGSKFVNAKFITEGFGGKKVIFTPPKTSPFEIFLGYGIDGKPAIINVKDVTHFLLSGSNGSGKSRMLDCILTTLIHNCTPEEVELYLAQISKNDLVIYEDAMCCRAFCETLEEVEIMLKHIIEKMAERDKLIKPMRKDFKGSDISDYNRLNPGNKLSVCWIIFDEVASVMNKVGNNDKVKKLKERIIAMMEEIARVGRALGIFLGCCLQRPKAESLSPEVKAQANLKISFAQNNQKTSEIAMDDSKIAIGLDERVAVYSCRGTEYNFVKTAWIDDSIIKKYVQPKSKRGHRNLFTDMKKLNSVIENNIVSNISPGKIPITQKEINKTKEIEEVKSEPIEFKKVDPATIINLEQRKKELIQNISDFVPYVDYSKLENMKIIDETKKNNELKKNQRGGKIKK